MNDHLRENGTDQLQVLEECRKLQEEILKAREGRPLPSVTALIHETREERLRG